MISTPAKDHRVTAPVEAGRDLLHRFGQRRLIPLADRNGGRAALADVRPYHVARNLHVPGPLLSAYRVDDAVDVRRRPRRIFQRHGGHGDVFIDVPLGLEGLDFMMDQQFRRAAGQSGRPAQDQHRRFLGIGLGDGIHHIERAGSIGADGQAYSPEAGIGIGGETGGGFVGGQDRPDRAPLQLGVQRQDEVPGDPEGMSGAQPEQARVEIGSRLHGTKHRGVIVSRRPR